MEPWRRSRTRRRTWVGVCALGLVGLAMPATSALAAPTVPTALMVSRCGFSHRSPSDPIVHPGMNGMSHSHDFFGNATTNADSTLDSLSGQVTTCKTVGDTSAYWVPTLYSRGHAVDAMDSLAYFQNISAGDIAVMPLGLKIVASGPDNVRWACFDHGMANAKFLRPKVCGKSQLLAVGIRFPECWNGADLDSSDHRSHMAYAVNGVCPDTHPVMVPRLTFWVLYPRISRIDRLTLSSGDVSTAHGDFFNTFDPATAQALHDYCLNGHRICYKNMYRVLQHLHLARNGTPSL